DVEPGDRAGNHTLRNLQLVDEQVVARTFAPRSLNSQSGRRVPLRVEVDKQGLPPGGGHCGGYIDRGGGLADTALLVGYCDPDHESSGTPLPTSMPPPGSVCECSTWNISWIDPGCSASSCVAERPLGNSHTVACVENRADKFSSLASGAKARAVITPAGKLFTLSRRAPITVQFASPISATIRLNHSTRRLRDSTNDTG